ncbi:unnamed protein product [Paramecium sonneborni]|uniref:Uncharacterized protein n=1 Tax=Paramecium sonneborni TaxID=65129 RepID=A0A8S1PWZ3_9CILI|nr:unnamed protein product [Paramecium sonneborni]
MKLIIFIILINLMECRNYTISSSDNKSIIGPIFVFLIWIYNDYFSISMLMVQ